MFVQISLQLDILFFLSKCELATKNKLENAIAVFFTMLKSLTIFIILMLATNVYTMPMEGDTHIRIKRNPLCSLFCCAWPLGNCGTCEPKNGYKGSKSCGTNHVCVCN